LKNGQKKKIIEATFEEILDSIKIVKDTKLTGKILVERYSPHLAKDKIKEPDFFFPAAKKRSFENHIVGFVHSPEYSGFNYILSNGEVSNIPYVDYEQDETEEVRIPEGAVIRKVIMYTSEEDNTCLWGVQFFDKDNKMLLEAGCTEDEKVKHSREFTLEEDERIVGVKSQVDKGYEPEQLDIVFILGRLV
jgi:hypothetical protein